MPVIIWAQITASIGRIEPSAMPSLRGALAGVAAATDNLVFISWLGAPTQCVSILYGE
jgi:hypothetical protein